MAKEKKSEKAGRKANSHSAAAYKAGFRRFFNKLRKVKRHVKQYKDQNAKQWLTDAQGVLAMDYVRGSEKVRQLHTKYFA
jgi:hypothetical protein